MTRRRRRALIKTLAGALLVVLVGWRVGAGPLVAGLQAVTAGSVVAAVLLGLLATLSCAWRWRTVARALGDDLPFGPAVAAYYRSQLLNATLPGGVLGDAHRAVETGQRNGSVRHGVRAVVWERTLGQVVQLALTLVVLLVLPSPLRVGVFFLGMGLLVLATLGWWLCRRLRLARRPSSGFVDRVWGDLRVLGRFAPAIGASSAVMAGSHLAVFVVAARAVDVSAPLAVLLPLGMLTLAAMGIPFGVGGWGPREGVAAWVFGAAALGSAQGLSTSVAYGVLALLATAPGAVVLAFPGLIDRRRPVGELVTHG